MRWWFQPQPHLLSSSCRQTQRAGTPSESKDRCCAMQTRPLPLRVRGACRFLFARPMAGGRGERELLELRLVSIGAFLIFRRGRLLGRRFNRVRGQAFLFELEIRFLSLGHFKFTMRRRRRLRTSTAASSRSRYRMLAETSACDSSAPHEQALLGGDALRSTLRAKARCHPTRSAPQLMSRASMCMDRRGGMARSGAASGVIGTGRATIFRERLPRKQNRFRSLMSPRPLLAPHASRAHESPETLQLQAQFNGSGDFDSNSVSAGPASGLPRPPRRRRRPRQRRAPSRRAPAEFPAGLHATVDSEAGELTGCSAAASSAGR